MIGPRQSPPPRQYVPSAIATIPGDAVNAELGRVIAASAARTWQGREYGLAVNDAHHLTEDIDEALCFATFPDARAAEALRRASRAAVELAMLCERLRAIAGRRRR